MGGVRVSSAMADVSLFRGNGGHCLKIFFLLLLSLLYATSPALTIEVNLLTSDPGGTFLFNTSFNHRGSYDIDEKHSDKHAREFLYLKRNSGVLLIDTAKACKHMQHNPVQIYVKFESDHNFSKSCRVSIPYLIRFDQRSCKYRNNKLFTHKTSRLKKISSTPKDKHDVHVFLSSKKCFQPNDTVLSLLSFIPFPFHQCKIKATSSIKDLSISPGSLDILFDRKECIKNDLQLEFLISMMCNSTKYHTQLAKYLFVFHPPMEEVKHSSLLYRNKRSTVNSRPVFKPDRYVKHFKEGQDVGTPVIAITATDSDPGDNGLLTYRMDADVNLRSQDMFAIDVETGTIKTTKILDREEMDRHYFTIYAIDKAIPASERLTASASLTIIVDDINDHDPVFQQATSRIEVLENGGRDIEIFTANAVDEDSGDNSLILYSILNPEPPNDIFLIDPPSGAITTQRSLDREEHSSYKLIIQAVDQGELNKRRTATMTLSIRVKDKNDNKPEFTEDSYEISLKENRPVSRTTDILKVKASDKDIGLNRVIKYRLVNTGQEHFMIDEITGKLYLIKQLNYEDEVEYTLSVRAEDSGNPVMRKTVTVHVHVLDINDNDPDFDESSYIKNIDEDIDVDANVIRVRAMDLDSDENAALTYSIIKPAGVSFLPFSIDSKTGWIKTLVELDREKQSVYKFMVKATDNGSPKRSASVSVTIGLRDINDNSPRFLHSVYNASISENARKGNHVINVLAEDKDEGDNARISYRIEKGNNNNAFQIRLVQGKGLITVGKKLDARDQSKYILTISASDIDGRKDTAQVVIDVQDTNRYAPEFQRSDGFAFSVKEDVRVGTSVFEVLALDDDRDENARITYSLTPLSVFSIDPDSGVIKTRQKLNRETVADYMLNVKATDNGVPAKSNEAELLVTVLDVNDNRPEFSEPRYTLKVKEDIQTKKDVLLKISATDKDSGLNGQIKYTFDGGVDGKGTFSVDNQGNIRLVKPLDREKIATYDLIVYAVDSNPVSPLSSSVSIHVDVLDVNDERPVFESDVFNVIINENSRIGSPVARITAVDPDEDENALVEYKFGPGSDSDFFKLSGRKGEPAIITTLKNLDYEHGKHQYKLNLQAKSGNFIGTTKVLINVKDINDNKPELEDFFIIFNNFGDTFPTGPIGRIPAYDPDVSDQDSLIYKIVSGNEANLLHLNETSGELTLDPRLNSDVPRTGTFLMSVSDGPTEDTATCKLWVSLVTSDMIHNAVTIRLDRMTATAFLSPLLTYFRDALASILFTDVSDVFVISVEDDTDVPERILNVSVSVRKNSVLMHGQTRDVFYSQEYLREIVYLHRVTLANLSTLQVLPFDDNLCLREPCTNFESCRSYVEEGIPRPVVTSNSVLFRSIHPTQVYKCVCPHGFAGMNASKMCDTEIDLCYSSPCHNGGACLRHESGYTCVCAAGFTGPTCSINMSMSFDSMTCPSDQCHGKSQCRPLPDGGFTCKDCPAGDFYDAQCRLRSRHFQKKSYLTFPSIKARNRFTISLRFATKNTDGLLLYNGRFNGEHDFIALEIVDGQVRFSFNLGSNETMSVTTNVEGGVSTGEWMPVTVEYVGRVATLTVGEDCDPGIVISYGHRLGSHTCAVRVEQELPEKCDNPILFCNRLLDLTGPLLVGSLSESVNDKQFSAPDFVGCISDLKLDHRLLDLDAAVADHKTTVGCPPKIPRCLSSPCQLNGKCREGWNTFLCDCQEKTGGKDCSQRIEPSQQFKGNGYLSFVNFADSNIPQSWVNGLAFRTRHAEGVLMQILLTSGEVVIEIVDGYIQYVVKGNVVQMDMVRVDDGYWHYFEVRWYKQSSMELFLDYEQHVKKLISPVSVSEHKLERIYIGAYREGRKPMSRFYIGCIKDIRVGIKDHTDLTDPSVTNVEEGCHSTACHPNPCASGQCVDLWNKHMCKCPSGTIGPKCEDVCNNYNPCQNWADCKSTTDLTQHPYGYQCECGSRQSGRYCQNQGPKTCPKGWWGKPLCGPCNCDERKGFKPSCNKNNGTCSCKAVHYLPKGSDTCVPCDCYKLGSTSLTCHPVTGHCPCHENIIGRRCDQCDNMYAAVRKARKKVKTEDGEEKEIEVVTCLVSYDDCPRNHAEGIWWEPVAFGLEASQDCPKGASGNAVRKCIKKDSWLNPDLFNCTSTNFKALEPQLKEFESKAITPYIADHTIGRLQNLSYYTPRIYGGDILMTYRFTKVILDYEMSHSGLEMISQRYRDFVQKLLVALSNVTNTSYTGYWARINKETGGATHLINLFEKFVNKTVLQMPAAKSPTFEAVSGDMVLGTDKIDVYNISTIVTIPKYDNNVRKRAIDKEAAILIPGSLLPISNTGSTFQRESTKAYVGYIIYRDIARLMTMKTDSSIRRTGRPMTVNSPMIGVILYHDEELVEGYIKAPIQLRLRLHLPNNRTNMYCARWVPSRQNDKSGVWTADGCRVKNTTCQVGSKSDRCEEYYVTCECKHLSMFAVIIDVADGTSLLPALIDMEMVTYVLVAMSLLLLLLSFFILFTFKRLQCKWNSIHINLIFTIIIVQVAYIIGINQTSPELFCRLVAIALHFFYIAAFSWLMVEVYHIHAMLTEKPSINHGSMKFYYLLAYVLPGIVVGLAVGLYTEAYGNASFCWLDTSESFIWSFAGPIIVVVVLFVLAFIRATKASYGDKIITNEDVGIFKTALLVSILLLLLLIATWVIGLLSVNFDIQALHYLHALCLFLDGLFIFLVYVLLNKKVRWCIKRFYYRLQGKKVEFDDIHGMRKPVQSRSALSYHQDAPDIGGGGVRISNMGMSTTMSTLSRGSRGSSKGTSLGIKSSVDILHSTSSSTSNGLATTTTIPPYGGGGFLDAHIKEERDMKGGNDSDSDSDGSMDRNSLELASSHSSDEDDDIDIGLGWEDSGKNNKAVELVREQIAKMKKEKEKERLESLNEIYAMDPQGVEEIPENHRASPPHYPMPSNPPDVTLHTRHQLPGQRSVVPPIRSDSLRYSPTPPNPPPPPPLPPPNPNPNGPPPYVYPHPHPHNHNRNHNPVQVLTHNGSVSSDSE